MENPAAEENGSATTQSPEEPVTKAKKDGAWFREMIDREVRNDKIGGGSLFGEIAALVAISAILAFFVAHELRDTGFYTAEFGPLEKFMLFGAGGFAVFLIALRIIVRRKNIVRPLDVASLLLFAVAHAVLLATFPFDFAYVGDALPSYLSWTVSWISDGLGAILLGLGVFGGTIGAVFTGVIYVNVKKLLDVD